MANCDKITMKMNKDRKWQYLSGMGWENFSIGNKNRTHTSSAKKWTHWTGKLTYIQNIKPDQVHKKVKIFICRIFLECLIQSVTNLNNGFCRICFIKQIPFWHIFTLTHCVSHERSILYESSSIELKVNLDKSLLSLSFSVFSLSLPFSIFIIFLTICGIATIFHFPCYMQ